MKPSEVDGGLFLAAEEVRTAAYRAAIGDRDLEDEDDGAFDVAGGTVIIPIIGIMSKSGFFGTSTVKVRQAILAAGASDVERIMLYVDSPGGFVAGVDELDQAVESVAAVKPVYAHIQDTGASAGYWSISHATRITANRMAEAGSIGAFTRLVDQTGFLTELGIQLHVVSSGSHKGLGADGRVTPELLEEVQGQIDRVAAIFFDSVASGRGLGSGDMAAVTTGRIFGAQAALELGLLDGVMTWEEALNSAMESSSSRASLDHRRHRARLEALRIRT